MPRKILITGGTGLVGSKLRAALEARGDTVTILTTSALRAEREDAFYWNLKDRYIDSRAFEGVDYIVHLAGAGVADKRWTAKRKKEIYDSRIENTKLLAERAKGHSIKGIVAASAIGYYGLDTGKEWVNESAPAGSDFLAHVVVDWEKSIETFSTLTNKVVAIRIGVVLSTEGGALPKMMTPFRLGVGSAIASGRQYMSWIHIDDLVGIFLHALDTDIAGIYNGVAPQPVTNAEFSKSLAAVLKKPFWFPNVPAFMLRLIFGELAGVLLGGNRVHAGKIQKAGYTFRHSTLASALKDLLVK